MCQQVYIRFVDILSKADKSYTKGHMCDSGAGPSSMGIDTTAQTPQSTSTGKNVSTGQSNPHKTSQPFCMIVLQHR